MQSFCKPCSSTAHEDAGKAVTSVSLQLFDNLVGVFCAGTVLGCLSYHAALLLLYGGEAHQLPPLSRSPLQLVLVLASGAWVGTWRRRHEVAQLHDSLIGARQGASKLLPRCATPGPWLGWNCLNMTAAGLVLTLFALPCTTLSP